MNYQNYKELILVLSLFIYAILFAFRFSKIKLRDVSDCKESDSLLTEIVMIFIKMGMFVSTAFGGMFVMLWIVEEGFKYIETNILG